MKPLSEHSQDEVKAAVADRYGRVATTPTEKFNFPVGRRFAESVGYDAAVLDRPPQGLWESFTGAGNPQPFVDALPGETLLDLGCGAGLDLYLYAQKVGPTGKVFGLDLSEAMLDKARRNVAEAGVTDARNDSEYAAFGWADRRAQLRCQFSAAPWAKHTAPLLPDGSLASFALSAGGRGLSIPR